MLILYLLTQYMDKLDDSQFIRFWEQKVGKIRRYFPLLTLVYYFVAVWALTSIALIGNDSFIMAMIMYFAIAVIYGYWFVRTLLRFIGKHSHRYLMVKSGNPTDTFDKSNVVN